MAGATLYEALGTREATPGQDRGETIRTLDDRETIDNDRAAFDLYAALGDPVPRLDHGRTERSAATSDTLDNDRAVLALYGTLGDELPRGGRGRTEYTAERETIDNDRIALDLYAALAAPVAGAALEAGGTDVTRIAPETLDRDRAGEALISALTGPSTDLYDVLARPARHAAADRGETEITHATETIDWDRPPEFPGFH